MIKVLLADDHGIVRAGLRRIIEESGKMHIIAEVSDGKKAVQRGIEQKPDVAIIDISMPGYDGLEVTKQLTAYYPDLPVIILTMYEEEQYIIRSFEAGAMGYLSKNAAPEELVNAIEKVMTGKRYLTEQAAEALALRLIKGAHGKSLIDLLSTRELQVLRRLALGNTNREIADNYNLSVKTIDTYRQRLLKKLGLRNNAELSTFAVQHNIIKI